MYTLTKEYTFEASHVLKHHDGKCARLHGHSWKARLILQGRQLNPGGPKRGMLMDYADVSVIFKPILDGALDHQHLNDTLQCNDPTSEFVARWIYDRCRPLLSLLIAVEVDETCTCSCRYEPEY